MAKKTVSKSTPTATQKRTPAAVVISEARDSLKRAQDHLTGLDGLLGILAEKENAAEYVSLDNTANALGMIALAVREQLAALHDRLGEITFDGQGNVEEGGNQ
jgi:hypothetical protein